MTNNIKNKVVCGFAGVGKSYLGKNVAGYIDLESTPFNKNWDLYTGVASHMQNNGYTPLVSCHKELRNKLKELGVPYVVVVPDKSHKANYMERYLDRGSTEEFVNLMSDNFEKWIDEILAEEENVIVLETENTTLADII